MTTNIPPRAQHPAHCHGCRGTGYMRGRAIDEVADGAPVRYYTLTTCTHSWRLDDPDVDEYGYDTRTPLAASDPRAQAAFERGYVQGLADLHQMRATDD